MKTRKPTIYPRGRHNVSRRDIDEDALKVLYRLHRSGHTAFLVGGGVRDLLLGRTPKDFDVSTDAHPNEIRRLFRNAFIIGRRFRLVHIRFGQKVIETSTFRREPDPSEVMVPGEAVPERDNTFGTPETDAWRRDFTINALFYNIADYTVLDYVGGVRDLHRRTIRCIGNPAERFKEDPVRMIRALRFAARMDFRIEMRTWMAIRRHAGEIEKAAAPRMLEEIYRLFAYRSGEQAFRWLQKAGMLEVLFPELAAHLAATRQKRRGPFWSRLQALDATGDGTAAPCAELIFGTLLAGLVAGELRHVEGRRPSRAHVAHDALRPIMQRYRVPRRVEQRLATMLALQARLENPGNRRGSRSRLVGQEAFEDALALYAIRVAAGEADAEVLEQWRAAAAAAPRAAGRAEAHGAADVVPADEPHDGSARRRPRRRRGGRRRSRRPRSGGGADAATAAV